MVEYGDPNGLSAMARTVGIPTGIAAKLLLEGDCTNSYLPCAYLILVCR